MTTSTLSYSIPRPRFPVLVWYLGGLLVFGLLALGVAAFNAFRQVAPVVQAFPAAVLIEAGMVVESMALIRRNWFAIPGLVISLIVSGTYNYIQAQQAGAVAEHPITNWWQLTTLAIGPLSALFFVALTIGFELREHEKRQAQWAADRQTWLEDQRAIAAQASAVEEANRTQLAQEEMRINAELEEKRIAAQQAVQIAKAEAEARAQVDAARITARAAARAAAQPAVRVVQPAQKEEPPAVQPVQKGSFEDFRRMQLTRNGAGPMQAAEIASTFHVSIRTAYDWLKKFAAENSAEPAHTNNPN